VHSCSFVKMCWEPDASRLSCVLGFGSSHLGRLQGVENQQKCQLAVCGCRTQDGNPYCSDDCQQAASQAIPRDFCQCAHGGCEKPIYHLRADSTVDFSSSISSVPGWLTIEYFSFEDLRRQLLLIAQAIDNRSEETLPFRAETPPRRNPSTELGVPARKAQSA
jgi:hypothetical protein